MDFRQLVTFIEVADLKSFSKASEKLYITQPAVTSQIQKLENELKTFLFDRSGKTISLTQTGEMFYKHARDMINIKSYATYEISQLKDKVSETLSISSSNIPQQYILPDLLKEFLYLYPGVKFDISTGNSKSVIDEIKNGYSNFGVVDKKYSISNIEYLKFLDVPVVLVLPKSYKNKFSPFESICLKQLKEIPLIIRDDNHKSSKRNFEELLKKENITFSQLNVIAYIKSNDAIKSMINSDIGASFLPQVMVEKEIKDGEVIPVNVDNINMKIEFYFATHKNRKLSLISKRFKSFMLDRINTKGGFKHKPNK